MFFPLIKIVKDLQPDECYHLAASSFVSYTFEDEISILNNNVNSTHYLLAAIREFAPHCRVYFAGTSEMFGNVDHSPQDENTPFNPRSIYGISKVASYHLVKNYRQQYGMFACSGILYNHESPRRGYEFVTRKIVSSAVKIKLGFQDTLTLGNLEALPRLGICARLRGRHVAHAPGGPAGRLRDRLRRDPQRAGVCRSGFFRAWSRLPKITSRLTRRSSGRRRRFSCVAIRQKQLNC